MLGGSGEVVWGEAHTTSPHHHCHRHLEWVLVPPRRLYRDSSKGVVGRTKPVYFYPDSSKGVVGRKTALTTVNHGYPEIYRYGWRFLGVVGRNTLSMRIEFLRMFHQISHKEPNKWDSLVPYPAVGYRLARTARTASDDPRK
eukprot:gene1489-biopygen10941